MNSVVHNENGNWFIPLYMHCALFNTVRCLLISVFAKRLCYKDQTVVKRKHLLILNELLKLRLEVIYKLSGPLQNIHRFCKV